MSQYVGTKARFSAASVRAVLAAIPASAVNKGGYSPRHHYSGGRKTYRDELAHQVPDWLLSAEKALEGYQRLACGWDTYNAPPPDAIAIENSRRIIRVMHEQGMRPGRIAPSAVGGIGMTFRARAKMIYLECRNLGETYVMFAEIPNDPSVRPVRMEGSSIADLTREIRDFLGT